MPLSSTATDGQSIFDQIQEKLPHLLKPVRWAWEEIKRTLIDPTARKILGIIIVVLSSSSLINDSSPLNINIGNTTINKTIINAPAGDLHIDKSIDKTTFNAPTEAGKLSKKQRGQKKQRDRVRKKRKRK